jgi:starch-binding outer membrane protein, SusD/RagB family
MKMNIKKLVYAGLLTLIVVVACEKKLNLLDTNSPTQESYFKTAAELQAGVNSTYALIRSIGMLGRSWHYLHDMRGGETNAGGVQLEQHNRELLTQATPPVGNAAIADNWNGSYQMINRANLVLSKAPDVTDNVALRDRIVGEAKFLRAWAYFELVSQWGDVPLYTEPVTSSTGFKGKESAANIYTQIIKDLTEAAAILPPSYSAADNGRATKGAANALLGRVNMQKGDYNAAKTALLAVYNSNLYELVPFLHNFDGDVKSLGASEAGHEFNKESVFEVAFYDRGDNGIGWGQGANDPQTNLRSQDWGIVWGNVIPSNRILEEFEPNDPRYKWTFFEAGDNVMTKGGTVPGVQMTAADMNVDSSIRAGVKIKRVYRKYLLLDWIFKNGSGVLHPSVYSGINQRLIRYADVLLMLAECEAEVGTPAQAAFYINLVRQRPGVNMPAVAPANKNDALKAVMHERAVELAGEGINNIDIIRWRKKGYFPSIMPDPRPGQIDFFPIPLSETSSNPLVK